MFDFNKKVWVQAGQMRHARFAHTALISKDLQFIIISGGYDTKPLRNVQIFNIRLGTTVKEF